MSRWNRTIIKGVFSKIPSVKFHSMVEGLLVGKTVETDNYGTLHISEVNWVSERSEIKSRFINFDVFYSENVDGLSIYKSRSDQKVVLNTLKSYLIPSFRNVLFSDYDMQEQGKNNIDVFF